MVLSQPEIKKAVKDGKIVFDPPLEDDQWGEASVDLRLDFSFTAFKGDPRNSNFGCERSYGTRTRGILGHKNSGRT
jgi:hypothetical protein